MVKARFPTIRIRSYKRERRRENEPGGTRLEAEVPMWMHKIYISIHTHTQKWIQKCRGLYIHELMYIHIFPSSLH